MTSAAAPRVSVIVPCHRAQDTIVETVRSVLAQTHEDWELILVSDDGDDYLRILNETGLDDSRLRQHPVRSHRAGHVAARNRGMQVVTGDLVADLDADDVWLPARLACLAPLAMRHGAALDVLECFSGSAILGYSGPRDGEVRMLDVRSVLAFDLPFHLLVRRDRLGETWFDDNLFAPDVIRTALLAANSSVAWLGQALLRYRVNAGSMSQNDCGDRYMDDEYTLIIERLEHGDGWGMPGAERAQAVAGFRRKRALNRRHIRLRRRHRELPAFVPWVRSGASAGATPID